MSVSNNNCPQTREQFQTTFGGEVFFATLERIDEVRPFLSARGVPVTAAAVINLAVDANPTSHPQFTQWLLDRWIGKSITIAEMAGGGPTLQRFVKDVKRLPAERWNIFTFLSPREVEFTLDQHLLRRTPREGLRTPAFA